MYTAFATKLFLMLKSEMDLSKFSRSGRKGVLCELKSLVLSIALLKV